MKKIFNWKNATIADIESDGLDDATKIYTLCYHKKNGEVGDIKGEDHRGIVDFFNYHIENNIPIVLHNGIPYDVPLVERLLGVDLSNLMVLDTLALSWYLNFKRKKHGLDSFFNDYGIAKPPIEDWKNLDYKTAKYRCEEDVKINKALWDDLCSRLLDIYSRAQVNIDNGKVGGKRLVGESIYLDSLKKVGVESAIDNFLTFLMFKMDIVRLKEKTKFYADRDHINKTIDKLGKILGESKRELEAVMPPVAVYKKKKKPEMFYKKCGELTKNSKSWMELSDREGLTDDYGNPLIKPSDDGSFIEVLSKLNPPNINSPIQIKNFLFSRGWNPITFDFKKDEKAMQAWIVGGKEGKAPEPRKIPQISVDSEGGKELCDSVKLLAERIPEINVYAQYNMLKHRYDLLMGMRENLKPGDYLVAGVGGFTNTLREKHRGLVNLPGIDKPYGKDIRGALTCKESQVLVGSDMVSLEDRVKHHFMLPYDPDYVGQMMAPDFDPHILMARVANLITDEEFNLHKNNLPNHKTKKARRVGKTVNYASVYLAGAGTIARAAGVSLKEGKNLWEAYWNLNWSVKAIAEEQVTINDSRGDSWLINPINGFCYSLRKDRDRFSTLCQGTGSFFFDMWLNNYLELMKEKYGVKRLSGTFHDELINSFNDSPENRKSVSDMLEKAVRNVNEKYKLRRHLGVDIQFGKRYSEIH